MDYLVTTHHVAPQAIVSIRDRCRQEEIPDFLKAAFPELFGRLGYLEVSPTGPPFVIYHVFGPEGIDAEVALPIAEAVPAEGRVESRVLPEMTVARTLHVGPYEELEAAYSAVSAWIVGHRFTSVGPLRERYLNGPGDVAASTEYRTEIEVPIIPQAVATPV